MHMISTLQVTCFVFKNNLQITLKYLTTLFFWNFLVYNFSSFLFFAWSDLKLGNIYSSPLDLGIKPVIFLNRYFIWIEMTTTEEHQPLLISYRFIIIKFMVSCFHLFKIPIPSMADFYVLILFSSPCRFGSVSGGMISLLNSWAWARSTMLIWYLR